MRRAVDRTNLTARVRPYLSVAVGSLSSLTSAVGARAGVAAVPRAAPPAAAEVVANFARGWVLFGIPDNRLAALERRTYPRRAIITTETARVSKRLRALQRRLELEIRCDQDFEAIIGACQDGRTGWLTPEAVEVYRRVHALGFISTVGAYRDGRLVGGLWGGAIGHTLGIMSMFHTEDNAGALALVALVEDVRDGGRWSMLDSGQLKENFVRYGAFEVPIERFRELVWVNTTPATIADATL